MMPKVTIRNKQLRTHVALWFAMYFYYVSSRWLFVESREALLVADLIKIGMQMLLAYGTLQVLIPRLLNNGKRLLFVLSFLLLLIAVFAIYTTIRYFYFEPTYPGFYRTPDYNFAERLTDFFYFFNSLTWIILPLIILIAIKYFRHEKEIIQLKAEKKNAELNALKNQLNPHFLFNTLNNLYALSLKKSDLAPEVIAKLSQILDYILYRCNEDYVTISGEVNLLHNYIGLEEVRYSKRLAITFEHTVEEDVKVAPLLLLTFLENAFKHGVSQEIDRAKILIELRASKEEITFKLENSKPDHQDAKEVSRTAIGMENVEKQLELLYSDEYKLAITEMKDSYTVQLSIPAR